MSDTFAPDRIAARRRALAGLGALLLAGTGRARAQAAPGERIEWPALTLLDGRTLAPEAWRDTAAVVVFWTTWCPFCRRHNARIDRLHRLMQAQGRRLRVLGVALDGDEAALREYQRANGYAFPVAAGQAALRARFTARRVIPTTCVVGRDGRLRECIAGEMAEDDVMALARHADAPAGNGT